MVEVEVLVYRPGAMLPVTGKVQLSKAEPEYAEINRVFRAIIGCRYVEHVNVLFRGERHDMFVGETSAKDGLPINEAATLVYHEASRQRGEDLTDAPKIHGIAVIPLVRVWT